MQPTTHESSLNLDTKLESPVEKASNETDPSSKFSNPQTAYTTTRSHKRHKSLDLSTITHPQSDIPIITKSESSENTKVANDEPIEPIKPTSEPPSSINHQDNNNVTKPQTSKDTLSELLGLSLDPWPYSDIILSSTIQLKAEKERTRREELRLATINQSIELIKLAVQANVPPHMISSVFTPNPSKEQISQIDALKDQDSKQGNVNKSNHRHNNSTSVFKVNIPQQQQQQFQFHHWQKPDGLISKSEISSTGSTIGSSSNAPFVPSTPNRGNVGSSLPVVNEEKKRKFSNDEELDQPTTPLQLRPPVNNHRRNQSEANVSQLRSIYESNIIHNQHQPQQPQQPQQPPRIVSNMNQQAYSTLRSPYVYPSQEKQVLSHQHTPSQYRPNYYQYPQPPPPPPSQQQQQHHQQQQQQQQLPNLAQGTPGTPHGSMMPPIPPVHPQPSRSSGPQSGPQFLPGPPQAFQFPQKRSSGPVQQQQPPPPPHHQYPQAPPQPPQQPTLQPLQPIQRGYSSAQSSPVRMKLKTKGDVSFLISTPNNPPK